MWIWVGVGLAVLMVLAAVAVIALPHALRQASEIRAAQHLEASFEAFSEGDYRVAFERANSANSLRRGDARTVEQLAVSALRFRHQTTARWWREWLEFPSVELESMLEYVSFLMGGGHHEEASLFLNRLHRDYPTDARVAAYRLRVLRELRRYTEARSFGQGFIAAEEADAAVLAEYAATLLSIPDEDLRREAREIMQEIARAEGEESLQALRILTLLTDSPSSFKVEAARRIEAHPSATRSDRLLVWSVLLREGNVAWEEIVGDVEREFAAAEGENLGELMAWLNTVGRPDEVLHRFSIEDVERDGPLFREFMEAKIRSEDPAQLRDAIELTFRPVDTLPLEPSEVFLLRARAQFAAGAASEAEQSLTSAVDLVEFERIRSLERFLYTINARELLERLYTRMLDNRRVALMARIRLLSLYYAAGDEEATLGAMDSLDMEDLTGYPPVLNLVAYLRIIYRRDATGAQRALEELTARFPDIIDFRFTLAFHYALNNRVALARELIHNAPELPPNAPRQQILAAAIVFAAVGDEALANEYFDRLSRHMLLPRESQLLSRAFGR